MGGAAGARFEDRAVFGRRRASLPAIRAESDKSAAKGKYCGASAALAHATRAGNGRRLIVGESRMVRLVRPQEDTAADRLRAFVDRLERLVDSRTVLSRQIQKIYEEAWDSGFSVRALRRVVVLRRRADRYRSAWPCTEVDAPAGALARMRMPARVVPLRPGF